MMTSKKRDVLPRRRTSLIALAVLTMINQASAQEAPQEMQRVEVTGSLIRRVADEGALPVTTIKATELEARGHTELKDLVLEMPQSLSLGTNSGAAGPVTNLRGLGPMRTLTLLDGRRLANEPLQDQYVSVNVIPRMALDRVETLRDGASSIYGADAIGGVLNFNTKRSYKGYSVKGEWNGPEAQGGGETTGVGAIAGWGDLNKDGWNAYISFDMQRKTPLFQKDRPKQYSDEELNRLGVSIAPTNRNASPSANFGFATGSSTNYNPTFATGCLAPYSQRTLGLTSVNTPPVYQPGCIRDPAFYTAVTDGSDIASVFAKATWAIAPGHKVGLEVLHSQFTVQKYRGLQTPGNTAPATTYTMPSTSRFYPGKGITPAVQVIANTPAANGPTSTPAMFIDATRPPGTVATLNMNNRPIFFQWGPAELGNAYRNDEQFNDRIVLKAEGTFGAWDYRTGINYGQSKRDTRTGEGYILYSKAQDGFTNGILNPFGLQDEAGLAYLKSIQQEDYTYRLNKAFNTSVDLTVSRDVMTLAGGAMTFAASAELRRDAAEVGQAPADFITKSSTGVPLIDQFGVVTKSDLVGETPTGVAKKLHRDIASLVMEVEAPVTSMLTLNASVRGDRYNDLKVSTVNPKLAFRLQPVKMLVIRGSVNTGFRAPSIMDIQNPTPEVRTLAMDDPILCPSSQPTVAGTGKAVAAYAATPDLVCNVTQNYWTKSPDNTFLKPEKSRGFSYGFALEPIKNMSLTVDFWGILLTDVLGAVDIKEIQQNPVKYQNQILRNSSGLIDHIVASQANRGMMRSRGVDVAAAYSLPTASWGTFNAKIEGTYYEKYEFQSEKDGPWLQNVGLLTGDGRYGATGSNSGLAGMPQINFRWKHTASLGWRQGVYSAQVSQRYNSGLTDVSPRPGSTVSTDVKPYSQYNVSLAYTGIPNLKLSLGINNITNVDPMLTASTAYNGYITSAADVLGRAYKLTAEYKF
ncbi:MAG: TonB-dependent receptor [Massilia sp.]